LTEKGTLGKAPTIEEIARKALFERTIDLLVALRMGLDCETIKRHAQAIEQLSKNVGDSPKNDPEQRPN